MSAFILKVIAAFSMLCDHSSYLIFGKSSFLNCIGRFAFPVFAFQIGEGYVHTHNLKKYFLRLFVFALVSQVPFMLFLSTFFSGFKLNIFFTLIFGLLAILIFDKFDKVKCANKSTHFMYQFCGVVIAILISALASFLHTDYGYFGVLTIFVFYLFREHKVLMNFAFVLLVLFYYGKNLFLHFSTYLPFAICSALSLVFIDFYNHKKGRDMKYFLYFFYPLHLIVLWILSMLFYKYSFF